ncbi:NAD(P)-binding protein [Thozetella sp. PMI_491]|nr:NAD(P)-binding protein [Thozetella sp. PMI_491]
MAPTIFITGVTGYIGGHATLLMAAKHPEWQINALVRDEAKAAAIKKAIPSVNTVIGSLSDLDILSQESAKADVVLNLASADDIPAIKAYLRGLSERPAGAKRFLIHTSGTGMLADFSTGAGNEAPRIYSDVDDVDEITSLPLTHFRRDVELEVINGGEALNVQTAIVSPPTIYGIGQGPLKNRSIQVPALIHGVLSRGKSFTVGDGKNVWDLVHVDDVSRAFILLTEEALKENGGAASWGKDGYYFTDANEFRWVEIAQAVAKYLADKGVIPTAELDKLSPEESAKIHPWGPLIWGSNARSRGQRLRKLGWKPESPTVFEELPAMVEAERKQL